MTTPRGKIDVHAHYLPGVDREALVAAGHVRPDGIPGLPQWDEGSALAAMDNPGVRLAVLISSPGVHFGDAASSTSTRVQATPRPSDARLGRKPGYGASD
jgi:hypothetical protein